MRQSAIVTVFRKDNTCIVILFAYKVIKIWSRSIQCLSHHRVIVYFFIFSSDDKARVVHQSKLTANLSTAYFVEPCLYFCHKFFYLIYITITIFFVETIIDEHSQTIGSEYIGIVKHFFVVRRKCLFVQYDTTCSHRISSSKWHR